MALNRGNFLTSALLVSFLSINTWRCVGDQKMKKVPRLSTTTSGDIIIGGLSPVHFSPTEAQEQQDPDSFVCQGGFNTRGFEAVEAMLFTMDMLNEGRLKDTVLPNITIGMDIKDTCTSADYAVRESLNFTFIRSAHMQDQCSGQWKNERDKPTVAVVGAAYSGVSMAVTNLCGLFYVPVVSYASTSRLLSNKVRFRYFLRTVPSDMLQARVMADLVRSMNWNYVIALSSDTEYGRSGIEAFKEAVASFRNEYDICIPVDEKFTKRSSPSKFTAIFEAMKFHPKAKVIILYAELHDADFLLQKFRETKGLENYIFIASDAWADSEKVLKDREHILDGMFGVVPEVVQIKEFNEYFVDFTDRRRERNPWMRKYEQYEVAHNPAFFRLIFRHYSKAHYVMDAVLTIAYALHEMLGCKPNKDCRPQLLAYKRQNQKPFRQLVDYIKKVRFPGMSREFVSFNDKGDPIGVYDIKHLIFDGKNFKFVTVGSWGNVNTENISHSNNFLQLNLPHSSTRQNKSFRMSFSRCSKECPPGYHKSLIKSLPKCCWECKRCLENFASNKTNMDECYRCPKGYWGNTNNSKCEKITPTYLRWADTIGIVIVCISGIGLIAVFATFLVFYVYSNTPVVRASSRELCYILLAGVAWCYMNPLFFIAQPSDITCQIIPFSSGLCFSLVAGTLLTKTNRISRIFNRKLMKTGTPSFLSRKWQLLMITGLCMVECLICAGMVFATKTGSMLTISETKKEVVQHCIELPEISVAVWWAYNAGLVLVCTYQAFLTRKIPENYNEAKFITFTMLTTCIVVTVYIPTYIGTSNIYRTTITCFVFIIGASATMACMFVPKVYIVLFRPQKNVPMQPRNYTVYLGTISPSTSVVHRLSSLADHTQSGVETSKSHLELPFPDTRAVIRRANRSTSLGSDALLRAGTPFYLPTQLRPNSMPQEKFTIISPETNEDLLNDSNQLMNGLVISSGLYHRPNRRNRDAAPCDEAFSILGSSLETTKYEENKKSTSNPYSLQPSFKACHFSSIVSVAGNEEASDESASETDRIISLNKTHDMKNKVKSSLELVGLSALEMPISCRQLNSRTVVTVRNPEKESVTQKHMEGLEESNSCCECDLLLHMQESEKEQRNFDSDLCNGSLTSFNDPNALSRSDETAPGFCPEINISASSETPMQTSSFLAPVQKHFGLSKEDPMNEQRKAEKKCCYCENLLVNNYCHYLPQRIAESDYLKSELQQQQFLSDKIKKREDTVPPSGQSQRQNKTRPTISAQKPLQSQSRRLLSEALSRRSSLLRLNQRKSIEMEMSKEDLGSSLPSYNRPQSGNFHPCHCLHTPISMSISMMPFVTPLTQPIYEGGTEQCAKMYGIKKTNSVSHLKAHGTTPQSFLDFERVRSNRDYVSTTSCSSSDLNVCQRFPGCFRVVDQLGCQRAPEHAQYLLRPDVSQSSRHQKDIVGEATGPSAEREEKETMI